ncbi:MAG: lipoyl(octanoyl) transferase LipB [Desulfobacterales bacterium]
MPVLSGKTCLRLELLLMEYRAALDLQRNLVLARQTGVIENDVVLILEHPPVFTLGRRAGMENLKASSAFLERKKIPVIPVERGGDITFHGPGQLVVYPIIDLTKAGLNVMDYVAILEEIMLRTASDWGIPAKRNSVNRGIWIANKKLGSVGISVQRGVTFHGFALNVNLSLKPFKWINPCGLTDVDVTSMEKELSQNISMSQVREVVTHHFESVFGFDLVSIDDKRLDHLVNCCAAEDVFLKRSRSS